MDPKNELPICYQIRGQESWEFTNPILSHTFVKLLGSKISGCPSIQGYIRFISYLSHTNIFIRNVNINKVVSTVHEYDKIKITETIRSDPNIKVEIDNAINAIKANDKYKAVGFWIPKPKEWETRTLIGDMGKELTCFNSKTF